MESFFKQFFQITPCFRNFCVSTAGSWNVARAVQGAEHLLVRGSVAAGESVAR